MKVKYAAVIVTYNRLELLKECLDNVEHQSIPAEKIIVVDNASTDGTAQYLCIRKSHNSRYNIITCTENAGGAGGFEKGIAVSLNAGVDCVLVIDDDAMIENRYMEKILVAREQHPGYSAFAGAVMTDGKTDTVHRRNVVRPGLRLKNCPEELYTDRNPERYFICDIASFCGMVVDIRIVKKVGLPDAGYFIWFDDTEYSLRINRFTKFLVVPEAILDHKTNTSCSKYPHRRYDWREYYGIRNRILTVKKHGNVLDRVVNGADMFCNFVLRNRLFGMLKMDGYDWAYENSLVRKAIRDAGSNTERFSRK